VVQILLRHFHAVFVGQEQVLEKKSRNWTVFGEECEQCAPLLLRDALKSSKVNVSI